MKELQITDAQLQKIVGAALRKHLAAAGFRMGASSGETPPVYGLPVNLDLAGKFGVFHDCATGVWTITQEEDEVLCDRTTDAVRSHVEAMQTMTLPRRPS